MKPTIVLAALLIVTSQPVWAQRPGPNAADDQMPFPGGRFGGPYRDNPQVPTGTAKISGRVISAETGGPVRRAHVRIASRDARAGRTVTTDADGRYEFVGLAAGRYRLYASKGGYVELEYGQARPFESGKPIDVVDGQLLDKLDFSLSPGSVITGRITDEFGDPATDVQVQAMRYEFANGERQLVAVGRLSNTDDLGQFRIFELMPGDYVVRASTRANGPMMAAGDTSDGPVGYPGTYYPGVSDVSQAQTVTVSLGQELSTVSFSLIPARLSRISGTVMSSDGHPLSGAIVRLRPSGGGMNFRLNAGASNQVRADGTFRLLNVAPGDYVLDVQQRPRDIQNLENLNLSSLEFASMPISVSGDIDDLAIVTTSGVTLSGRVVVPESTPAKPSLRGIQVTATSPSDRPGPMAVAARALGSGRVDDAGAFELHGLAGPQFIRASGLPAGWGVKTILLDGADITDGPFDFRPGANLSALIVTLTNRLTEIAGSVHDVRGQPLTDYVLIVFAEDSTRWGPQSRYVATARPDQNGSFSIKGLPPARYLAAVVPSLETGRQNDVTLLEQLRGGAQSFALAEGQTLTLNLEMSAMK